MGLLTADARADLLDRASWVKDTRPGVRHEREYAAIRPGAQLVHRGLEDGETDVLVYHARDYRDIVGDPLNDPNRHTRVQRLYWHRERHTAVRCPRSARAGPGSSGSPRPMLLVVVRPSPRVQVVRVDTAVRELADTQFRFVPGFAGTGTEGHPVGQLPRPLPARRRYGATAGAVRGGQ